MSYSIGLLSGTSMDAIDAALADCGGDGPRLLASHSHAFPASLRESLAALAAKGAANDLATIMPLHAALSEAFAAAVTNLLDQTGHTPAEIACIGFHGQTIAHQPDGKTGWSLQLGDPNRLALLTGIPVVSDFRGMDIAAGGQGAPLAPLLHKQLFQSGTKTTAVVNIGGIANLTLADGSGFDTGPGNCLLDLWIKRQRAESFDAGGQWAAGGEVITDFLDACLNDPYFRKAPPKSTGTDYFSASWLEDKLPATFQAADIQASLAELTARGIATALLGSGQNHQRLLVCGGGARNLDLLTRIRARLPALEVTSTASVGIDPDWVEALLFAWLGWRRIQRLPVDTRPLTGARQVILAGAVYRPAP